MPTNFSERLPITLSGSLAFFLNEIAFLTEEEREKVSEALCAAAQYHGSQRRKDGNLFIIHPVQVASILASLRLDMTTIMAGLLHDVIEDTSTTAEEIEYRFGKEVRQLVEAVTHYQAFSKREFMEKILVRAKADERVAMLKIADRCANLMHHSQNNLPLSNHASNIEETESFYIHRLASIPELPSELLKFLQKTYLGAKQDYQNRLSTTS